MPRTYSLRGDPAARNIPDRDGASVGAPEFEETCASYAPGHQMHYLHQGQALRDSALPTANVIVEGYRVIVVLESGEQLDYHHHDPHRLGTLLGLFPGSRFVYPQSHSLRVGPYWFNCAPDEFEPCRPGEEVSGP